MRLGVLVALSVLALFALSGCIGGSSEDPNDASRRVARRPAPQFNDTFVATLPDGSPADASLLVGVAPLAGMQRLIGSRSFEPTLGINQDGHLYVVAFDRGNPRIRVSRDEGLTWTDTQAKLPTGTTSPPQSNDPFVYVDKPTGRVFTSDLQALVCSYLNYSDDGGRTWVSNPIGCGHPVGVHDHQSIATGKSRSGQSSWQGRMVYYCVNRVGDSSCAASPNGGLAFGPLVPVMLGVDAEAGRLCGGLTGHVKTDHAGRVFLGKSHCGRPTVAVSEDDGRSWSVSTISRSVGVRGHDVEIATDAKDNVYAFWISDAGVPTFSVSQDHAKTWGPALRVAPPGTTAAALPAIVAGGEGRVAFAYVGTEVAGGYRATDWSQAQWHGYISIMTDAMAERPVSMTTIIDSKKDPLAVRQCVAGNDDRCAGMGDFIDIQLDAKGRPWAAFVDVCHAECLQNGRNESANNQGVVGTLVTGPSLLDGRPLPALVGLSAREED